MLVQGRRKEGLIDLWVSTSNSLLGSWCVGFEGMEIGVELLQQLSSKTDVNMKPTRS